MNLIKYIIYHLIIIKKKNILIFNKNIKMFFFNTTDL